MEREGRQCDTALTQELRRVLFYNNKEVTCKYFLNQEIMPKFSIYSHQNVCIFIIAMTLSYS